MDTVLKLRELRARAGLTQEEVATRSGIGVKTISSFESGARIGTMKVAQLERILAVYNRTLDAFFSPALDAELAPWEVPHIAEASSLVHDIAALPSPVRAAVTEKIRVVLDLARDFAPMALSSPKKVRGGDRPRLGV
jgi:transcriptional regulator with XRE-family HTH domain